MNDINIKRIFIVLLLICTSFILVSSQNENHKKLSIKIISYNIHSGTDKNMVPTLFDTIAFLKKSNADIICLQEVNESAKVGFQVSCLKEELGMSSHFGANISDDYTNYGLVTYSKYKIISKKHIYLSSKKEQRGFLHTVVKVKNKRLNILNIHLGVDDIERKQQLKELSDYMDNLKKEYFIILGDFNQGELSIDNDNLKDVAEELNKSNSLTFSNRLDRIDYIFVSKNIEIKNYKVLIEGMSDHYPIVTNIYI